MDPILYEGLQPSRRQRIQDAKRDPNAIDLFSPAPSVKSDTSKAAAANLKQEARTKLRDDVLGCFQRSGYQGLARFEIAALVGKYPHEITSTVDALIKLGLIKETQRKRINSRTNQSAFVLVATEYSEAAA